MIIKLKNFKNRKFSKKIIQWVNRVYEQWITKFYRDIIDYKVWILIK